MTVEQPNRHCEERATRQSRKNGGAHKVVNIYGLLHSLALSPKHPMDDTIRYRLFKLLQEQPGLTQRELAKEMGISLGKTNYCLQALIRVGMVKAKNFKNSKNKSGYLYLLTPEGIDEKAHVTRRFLKQKRAEFEEVQREISELHKEIKKNDAQTRKND